MSWRSRLGRFLLMEAEGPSEGEDVEGWLADASSRMEQHGDRAQRDFLWAAVLLVVGGVLAFTGVADSLLQSAQPKGTVSGAVVFIPGAVVGVAAGWHAGRAMRWANSIQRALGGRVQFWNAYRVGAVVLALAILALQLRGCSV